MILERRDFLKLLGLTAGSVGLGGCGGRWAIPDDLVEMALRGPGLSTEAQTICGLCEGGCGLSVRLVDGLPVGLKGNPHHPLNRGGLCPVGQAGLEVLYSPDRLEGPLRKGEDGSLEPTNWDGALAAVGERLRELRAGGKGERLAVLLGPSDSLFSDLVGTFAAFVGSPHLAHLGGGSAVPYLLGQGVETPTVDLAAADMVLSLGLDIFEEGSAPLRAISAMIGERQVGQRAGLIHVGTRLSPSATKAHRQVWIRPGTYPAFTLGVAHVLVREGRYDKDFVESHTLGFEDWIDDRGRERMGFRRLLLERYYPDRIARLCGVDAATIVQTARMFSDASAPVAIVGGEAISATNGTWASLATQAVNALIGAFGREGGVGTASPIPFGALRDTGSHSDQSRSTLFAPPDGNGALGVDPILALTERVLSGDAPVDVLIVAECDPLRESPLGDRLRQAFERIPLVVTLTSFLTETARAGDLILATHAPLEAWRAATTPAGVPFSVLGLSEPVIEPLYETRNGGDILLEMGRRAGGDEGSWPRWESYEAYLEDRISGVAASGEGAIVTGSFEEGWKHFLEERGWRFTEGGHRDGFWRDLRQRSGWWSPVRVQADWSRIFGTASGRFEFSSAALDSHLRQLGASGDGPAVDDDEALRLGAAAVGLEADIDEVCLPHYEPPLEVGDGDLTLVPFRPLTARGLYASASPMVNEMFGYPVLSGWETWAEITETTAHHLDLGDGDRVAIESDRTTLEAVVRVAPAGSPDVVHVPVGLGLDDERARDGRVGSNPIELVVPMSDGLSGAIALSSTKVRLRVIERRRHGGPAPRHGGHGA